MLVLGLSRAYRFIQPGLKYLDRKGFDMVTDTRERQLWWRHLISILVFPVTVTLVVPALIVTPGHARLNFDSPLHIGSGWAS
jgi:hypothetical protein